MNNIDTTTLLSLMETCKIVFPDCVIAEYHWDEDTPPEIVIHTGLTSVGDPETNLQLLEDV